MKIKDKELKITINGEEQDVMNFLYEDFLKAGEYIYKENGKWYIHKLKYVAFEKQIEEKKIPEKLSFEEGKINDNEFLAKYITNNRYKINEIIDYLLYLKSKGE